MPHAAASSSSSPDQAARIEALIARFIERHRSRFTTLSDRIWDLAEIGYAEHRSAAAQQDVLRDFGFHVTDNLAGMPTAFIGETGGGSGGNACDHGNGETTIAFLGEFDALPGLDQAAGVAQRTGDGRHNGHACGHHLLGTGSLLAAIATADYLKQHGIAARVRYYGCPAEENGIGNWFHGVLRPHRWSN